MKMKLNRTAREVLFFIHPWWHFGIGRRQQRFICSTDTVIAIDLNLKYNKICFQILHNAVFFDGRDCLFIIESKTLLYLDEMQYQAG